MARFFQHLEAGDKLGKITKLKYIDDITDDDMILYYFEDGTKCNPDMIAPVGYVVEDFEQVVRERKAMVELAGPNYAWSIMQKEVIPETSSVYVDEVTGERFEIVGRDVQSNGTRDGATIDKVAQKHMRTELKLPSKPSRFTQEPNDDYMLSVHPELENAKSGVADASASVSNIFKKRPKKVVQQPVADFDFDADEAINDPNVAPSDFQEVQQDKTAVKIDARTAVAMKAKNLNISLDKLTVNNITVSDGDWSETLTIEELRKRLSVSSDEVEQLRQTAATKSPFEKCIDDEDVLVKNMIDKSKKKNAKIMLAVSIPLPPKEVYGTIKDVYEEGMADQFVKSVTARISMDKLLESLADGMKKFYEGQSQSAGNNE